VKAAREPREQRVLRHEEHVEQREQDLFAEEFE